MKIIPCLVSFNLTEFQKLIAVCKHSTLKSLLCVDYLLWFKAEGIIMKYIHVGKYSIVVTKQFISTYSKLLIEKLLCVQSTERLHADNLLMGRNRRH